MILEAESAAGYLSEGPNRGRRVPNIRDARVREIPVGSYRMIYRVAGPKRHHHGFRAHTAGSRRTSRRIVSSNWLNFARSAANGPLNRCRTDALVCPSVHSRRDNGQARRLSSTSQGNLFRGSLMGARDAYAGWRFTVWVALANHRPRPAEAGVARRHTLTTTCVSNRIVSTRCRMRGEPRLHDEEQHAVSLQLHAGANWLVDLMRRDFQGGVMGRKRFRVVVTIAVLASALLAISVFA